MSNFTTILNQSLTLFILILIGFVVKKLNIVSDELGKGISKLIINVTLPLLIVTSMNYDFSQEMLNNSLLILSLGVGIFIFMMAVASLFTKLLHTDEPQRGVYKFLIIFSNTGFMGYPILAAVFGDIGIFYGAVFNLLFNIMLWTVGIILMDSNNKRINLKELINPGIISVLIGFTFFIFSIKLPDVLFNSFELLGDTTTPLAMLIVGTMLGDANIKEMLQNYKLFIVSAVRLVIIPVILILALSKLGLPEIVYGTLILVSAMPSAANTAIFARIYDSDYKLASQGIFVTTLFSIITIPLTIWLMTKM